MIILIIHQKSKELPHREKILKGCKIAISFPIMPLAWVLSEMLAIPLKEEYYKRIMNGENKLISNLFPDSVEGKLVLASARAINKDGKFVGTIVGIIDIERLHEILSITNTIDKSRYTLLDKSGTAVFLNESKVIPYDQRSPMQIIQL